MIRVPPGTGRPSEEAIQYHPEKFATLLVLTALIGSAPSPTDSFAAPVRSLVPFYFIHNEGQLDPKVRFYEKGPGRSTFFATDGVVQVIRGPGRSTAAIRLFFPNGNPNPEIAGDGRLGGRVNTFIGNDPKKWRSNIPAYESVRYREIFPGVDVRFYGTARNLEYDLIVSPGSDPAAVRLGYGGIDSLKITGGGDLEIHSKAGKLIQKRPVLYQVIDGRRIPVAGGFKLPGKGAESSGGDEGTSPVFTFGFTVDDYDRSRPLYIDPVLRYATYLGGAEDDEGFQLSVDPSGDVYVTGRTLSADFPVTGGSLDADFNGAVDAFVVKLDESGTRLEYATFLGGSDQDIGYEIVADASGNAYVTGSTLSSDFPVTAGAFETTYNTGGTDCFVAKLDSSGGTLLFSTFLGGLRGDVPRALAVDGLGNTYVSGQTTSADFPTTPGSYDESYNNETTPDSDDIFVTKLDADGSSLLYSTYVGGGKRDTPRAISVDGSNQVYVVGITASDNFPIIPGAFDTTYNGVNDAVVFKVNAAGTALIYSTYIGGSDDESGLGMALNGSGEVFLTGGTFSPDFPTTPGAFSLNHHGNRDGYAVKLSADGATLVFSTYFGGHQAEIGRGIALDASENVWVTGFTQSPNFPVSGDAFDADFNGLRDAYAVQFDPAGENLLYGTFLGGTTGETEGRKITVDALDNTVVAGFTGAEDFPATPGAFNDSLAGSNDVFVASLGTFAADLSVDQTDSPDPVGAGETLTYTISVTNNGSDSTSGVILTDLPPSGAAFVSAVPTQGACEGTDPVVCDIGDLEVDGDATVTLTVLPGPDGPAENTASVTGDENDPDPGNNASLETTTVEPRADLSLTKTDSPDPVLTGGNLVYSLTVTNNGPSTATGIDLSDTLPAGVSYDSATTTQGSCSESLGVVDCSLDSLADGAAWSVQIMVTAGSPGPISNSAVVSGAEVDPDSGNNTAGADTDVTSLSVSPKFHDFGNIAVGSSSPPQTFTVMNVGTADETVSGAVELTGVDGGQFQILSDTCSDQTLSPSEGCAVDVAFVPSAPGPKTALLSIPTATLVLTAGLSGSQKTSLTVSRSGSGSGHIGSSPSGIDCGGICQASFDVGSVVTLVPDPDTGSVFAGWTGDAGCTGGSVTMNGNIACTAVFNSADAILSVSVQGGGSGRVVSNPGGIDCKPDCSQSYPAGTVVALTAAPDAGSVFSGWGGDCSGAQAQTSVTLFSAQSCTATFDPDEHSLSVSRAGDGTGTVTSSPPGIDCGSDCSENYAAGTEVDLSAQPGAGSVFDGWGGDADCSDGVVIMDDDTFCTATFTVPVTGSGDVDGSGRVDGFDLGRLGLAFGSREGDPRWNPDADLNRDGMVDQSDLNLLLDQFGKTQSP